MSHDEERVNGGGFEDEHDRAPRHWLNPLVELSRYAAAGVGRFSFQFEFS